MTVSGKINQSPIFFMAAKISVRISCVSSIFPSTESKVHVPCAQGVIHLVAAGSTKPGRSDRNSRPSSRRHGRLASRSAGSRIAPDCSGYCPGRANQSGTGIAVSSGRLGWPSVHTAYFTSPSSRFALSQAVQRAQSSASCLVRRVLALVGQPVLRTTAFQVPAGVLTIVAI